MNDGHVLLSRRPPGDRLAGFWELPGGKIEAGETPEEWLARELADECGREASIGSLFADSAYRNPHGGGYRRPVSIASDCRRDYVGIRRSSR